MKYFAKKVYFDGHTFDSSTERDRYIELQDLQSKGEISQLRLQQSFEIIPRLSRRETVQLKTKTKIIDKFIEHGARYTCDFVYRQGKQYVMEEVKSTATKLARDYSLRRKLIIKKILEHNEKGRGQWKFREITQKSKRQFTIKEI